MWAAVKWVLRLALRMALILCALYATKAWASYLLFAHRNSASDRCSFEGKIAAGVVQRYRFHCIDVDGEAPREGPPHFVLFMAHGRNEDDVFGHSWVAFLTVGKDQGESLRLTEYQAWGFWGNGKKEAHCAAWQPVFALAAPFAARAGFSRAEVDSICQGGFSGRESRTVIQDARGVVIRPATAPDQLHNLLGGPAEVVVAVHASEAQFDGAKSALIEQGGRGYFALVSDCTTLPALVAERIGLYTPECLIYPQPLGYVQALAELNLQ